jgi:TM2 domain-containing membrane protein YozV
MALTTEQHLLIESRVTNEGPSVVVAYLFWFFLGIFSAHRFYLGRAGTAILQILLFFVLIGFVWLFVDVFLIPGMVRSKQQELRQRLAYQLNGQFGLAKT